jgi:hypothetical protein
MKRLLKLTAIALVGLFLAAGLFLFVVDSSAYANENDGLVPETLSSVLASEHEAARTIEDTSSVRLSDTKTPRASFLQDDGVLAIWRSGDSWSLSNSFLSLIGLVETFMAIGIFFRRSRQGPPNLWCSHFLLITLSLLLVAVAIAATIITSDFTKGPVVFDRMSLSIVILFGTQQAVLLVMEKAWLGDTPKKKSGHFRAMKRFEG